MGLPDALILRPPVYEDGRGYFSPSFNRDGLKALGVEADFLQDNQSLSRDVGTIRGLHAQHAPYEQAKLVRVLAGRIFDVLVDARPRSSHFGKWEGYELSADSHEQVYIPRGFLHGFMTLEPNTVISYKVDNTYAPDREVSVMWNDSDLEIDWPLLSQAPVLSGRDRTAVSWTNFKAQI